MSRDRCPALEDLLDPLDAERERVEWHLTHCPRCRVLHALGREVGQPPVRAGGEAGVRLPALRPPRPPAMPDRVRTGDVWQLIGIDGRERYVAVVSGVLHDPARPLFTIAGTSPELALAGPGDVVVGQDARGVRAGYELMVCTWSAAGTPEDRFEQYLGRVDAGARSALVSGHRRFRPLRADGIDRRRVRPVRRGVAQRTAFRARLQQRLDDDLIPVDPRDAQLPIPDEAHLDGAPPAWLTALDAHFRGGTVPPPAEAARILRVEGVGWLPSTKRRIKRLFIESGAARQQAVLDLVREIGRLDPELGELPSLPSLTPQQRAERYARAVGRALG